MSVQNLREKFNQPSNGSISPPGTSFASVKTQPTTSTTKSETFSADNESSKLKTSPFGPSINGKMPTHFCSSSPASKESSSPSPDRLLNGSPKPYVNGGGADFKTTRKSPEQNQQEIILRKWNRNSVDSESSNSTWNKNSTNSVNSPTPESSRNTWNKNMVASADSPAPWARNTSTESSATLSKPKSFISRYINNLSVDGNANDCDTPSENGSISHDRAEQLKNKYEINSTSTAPPKRESFASSPQPIVNSVNRNTCNSSFLNSVRSKMNEDTSLTASDSNIDVKISSLCNGLKKTNSSDKWKSSNSQDERDTKITLTNKVLLPTQDYSSLEKKYHTLQKDHDNLKREFKEKNDQLIQLRKLSEAMYKEYDQLRNQYKLETSTMHQAMERATQWYKQNRELKRQSTALLQHVISTRPDAISEMGDEVDTYSEQDSEIEALRKTIKDLTKDMSKLQAELNSIKVKETEAQEQITYLTKQLETERRTKLSTSTLKQKERCATSETINQYDSVEDKLRATEVELHLALERANHAEAGMRTLSDKVSELENELQEIKNKATCAPPAPPAPPPPPPPPPLPSSFSGMSNITNVVLRKSIVRADQAEDSAAEQMADLLGIPKKSGIPKVQGGAIDDIINEIKGGRFTLKATEKQNSTKKEEPPPVVHEMINVLGTLRRQPNRKKSSSTDRALDK